MNSARPPSVDALARLIRSDRRFSEQIPGSLIVQSARAAIQHLRGVALNTQEFEEWAKSHLENALQQHIRPVINASGVILHTGLGRARLAPSAQLAVSLAAASHSAVEIDLGTGERGDRQLAVRDHLIGLSGAPDAMVINNCAGAVFLALAALCQGQEVLLSRGQMVEIGGSYRMPEIVEASGARLVEVGCTNKTHLTDYVSRISSQTGAIVRCHRSNFAISGFTDEPSPKELSLIAREHGTLFLDDLGSGCFVDTSDYGLPKERTVQEAVADGADLVMFSGDKLLGGPQAGLIVGKPELIARLKSHPLARALRADKLTLAGVEATLRLYRTARENEIPVWRYVSRPLSEIQDACRKIEIALPGKCSVEPGFSVLGGGSMPEAKLETVRLGLSSSTSSANSIASKLRDRPTPVITSTSSGKCWIDPRTIEADELEVLIESLMVIMAD